MIAVLNAPPDRELLPKLREALAGIDPDARMLIDRDHGELLVQGNVEPEQLRRILRIAGADAVDIKPQGGCCGGCGCG